MSALLDVENLRVTFPTPRGPVEVVKGVSFTLGRERLGIVGESGSGKSMTGRAILQADPPAGRGHAPTAWSSTASTSRALSGARDARHPRRAHLDGDAGPEILAQPGDDHRRRRSPRRC